MTKKILKAVGYIISVLLFLIGLLIFCYPLINNYTLEKNIETTLETFHYLQGKVSEQSVSDDDNTDSIYNFDLLYEDMQKYNENIFSNGQSNLKDVWSYEQAGFDLSAYGIFDTVIAEIRIPKMDVDLPIYLGATWDNMSKGAVQLGQTSMPVGGNNTNCVIAGHRGSSGGEFFLNIEKLEIGDNVYIDNLWETLTYKVSKIDVISPDDIDKILIQKDRDMVTLITCHPYPYNYQRYVVYCERTAEDGNEKTDDTHEESEYIYSYTSSNEITIENSSQYFIVIENILYVIIPIFLVILAFVLLRKRKDKINK